MGAPPHTTGSATGSTAPRTSFPAGVAAGGPAAGGNALPPRELSASREAAPTRDAALTLLMRHGDATAAELANHLQVSVQVMRRHLRSLEEDGLVEASTCSEGPGRPTNRWRLTADGHGRFPDGSENFALGLLHSMAASLPAETIRHLMERQAIEKATSYRQLIGSGSLQERLEKLLQLRRAEGYEAELHREDATAAADTSPAWVISEFHCSVMRIAEEFPMVCDQELQLLRHTFPDCQVERVHWRIEEGHSCGFRLHGRSHPAGAAPSA